MATLGHNIGQVLVAVHMYELDNALRLGFLGALVVEYV